MNTVVCLIITIIGWGLYHIFAKQATRTLHPAMVQLLFSLCAVIALPCYYLLVQQAHKSTPIRWSASSLGWVGAAYLASSIGTLAYVYALSQKDVGQVVGIATSYPVLVLAISVLFMGETLTWAKGMGVLLVVAGIFVSSRG